MKTILLVLAALAAYDVLKILLVVILDATARKDMKENKYSRPKTTWEDRINEKLNEKENADNK